MFLLVSKIFIFGKPSQKNRNYPLNYKELTNEVYFKLFVLTNNINCVPIFTFLDVM